MLAEINRIEVTLDMNDYLAYRIKYSSELYHYGVKGQKWGIRRYQNPNGTLTEEGKIRYGVDPKTGKLSDEGKKLLKQDIDDQRKRKVNILGSLGIGVSIASAVAAGVGLAEGIISTNMAIGTLSSAAINAGVSAVTLLLNNKQKESKQKESKQKGGNS